MPCKLQLNLGKLLLLVFITVSPNWSSATEFSLNTHLAHYDREFNTSSNDRRQTGLGLVLGAKKALFDQRIKLSGSVYHAQHLASSGRITPDILAVKHGDLSSFSLLGEAQLTLSPIQPLSVSIGRLRPNSLFLKSKKRALPSTFEGIQIGWKLNPLSQLYFHQYRKWSPRASDKFVSFQTNNSDLGAIKYINVIGGKYKAELNSATINLNIEYLEAHRYIRKFGLVTQYSHKLRNQSQLSIESGLFSSMDAGDLFIDGANDGLDSFANKSKKRLEHRGFGVYLSTYLNMGNHRTGLVFTKISDPWLEDSFAHDHGTTPFPTRTYGPELTNKNESIVMADYRYRWTTGSVKGLEMNLAYANGSNIENSIHPSHGTASERWAELDLRYRPKNKPFSMRLRYRDYRSSLNGEVVGVKGNRRELRVNLNYIINI